ncbi:Beta-hexosaminidase [hydrothermal vent metagenome]|uniref:Beta-hexosaminidase n=1 Tax=hydrothermal vent metagenome TaxID=652676 RepID=A0A1W1BAL2_9ZZZZ
MVKIFTIVAVLLSATQIYAKGRVVSEQMVGSMLMVGFYGTSAKRDSQICRDIKRYNLAGVILFDFNPTDRSRPKNISNKKQLAQLTRELKACSRDGKLLIAIDQEGGRVQRLKSKYGFYGKFLKASDISKLKDAQIKSHYTHMAKELKSVGLNYDLAPVVDLDINPKNHVIHGLGRSFGSDPKRVAKYASLFISSMHDSGVLTSLKHFPGHGSSTGDTHKGFVDVTNQWQSKELEPYKILISQNRVDTVMVAHVYNKNLDPKYPATLSSKIINGKLRGELGFRGVVITDDMQMGAIGVYSLKDRIRLAINAGNDILLFGNQLNPRSTVSTKTLIDTIISLVNSKSINPKSIRNANIRVKNLKNRL